MFVDEIKLSVSSGAGGPGSVSFNNLNSKTKPSGGSGGDDTLFAKTDGVVKFSTRNGRKLVNVIPK